MRVIGIDPGSLFLGWGILTTDERGQITSASCGTLSAHSQLPFYERLHKISAELAELLDEQKPQVAVIERIFLGKNVDSAFKLGHIRGVCAVECQKRGIEITEYAPRTVKKQITGSGNSDKFTVQSFLSQQLSLPLTGVKMDATDALALAFCHWVNSTLARRLRQMEVR